MKKNLLKVSILSLSLLVICLILVRNDANAANQPVNITMAINAWTLSCTNPSTLSISAASAWFSANQQTWTFAAASWYCVDMLGNTCRTAWVNVALTWDLIAPNWTISSWNVQIKTTSPTVESGACTIGTAQTATFAPLSWSVVLYRKTAAFGQVCRASTTPTVIVNVPANQAPGSYAWVIQVTDPS